MSKDAATGDDKAEAPAPKKKNSAAELVSDPENLRMMAANMASHETKSHAGAALFAFGGVVVLAGALWAVIASATGGAAMSLGPLIMLGAGGVVMSVTGLTRMREGEVATQLRAALVLSAERAERAAARAAALAAAAAKPSERSRLTDKSRPEPRGKKSKKDEEPDDFERGVIHAALAQDQMLIKSYHLRELHKSLRERISEAEAALQPDEHVSYVLMAETLKMQTQVLVLTGLRMAIINDNRVEWHFLKDVKNPIARWKSNSPQCEFSTIIDGKPLEWSNVEPEAAVFHAAKMVDAGVFPLPARHIATHPSPITVRTPGRYLRGTLTSPSSGSMVSDMSMVEVVLTANNVVHIVSSGESLIALPASDQGLRLDAEAIIASELKTGPLADSTAAKTLLGPMRLRGMPRDEPEGAKPHLVLMVSVDDLVGLVLMTDQASAERIVAATKLPPPVEESTPPEGQALSEGGAPAAEAAPTEDVGAMAAAIMAAVAADNSVVSGAAGTTSAPPASTEPIPAGDTASLVQELERVQKLHSDGVLTDEELRSLTRRLVADDGAA
jgi:hypothetical protein